MTNVSAEKISNLIVSDDSKDDEGVLLPNAILKRFRPLRYEVVVPSRWRMGLSKQIIGITYPSDYSSCSAIQREKIVKHWADLPNDMKIAVLTQSSSYEDECFEDIRVHDVTPHETNQLDRSGRNKRGSISFILSKMTSNDPYGPSSPIVRGCIQTPTT